MNYRHQYHAGNFADVFKHIVLIALTQSFLQKDSAFCYLDTHAGIGQYDLFTKEAQKTREFSNGISQIFLQKELPTLVQTYKQCIQKINTDEELRFYPGSPLFVKELIRPQDRMVLSELQNEDVLTLKKLFARNPQIAVHNQDGYQSLKAFIPPKERRGLVLIDPPYEQANELEQLTKKLPEAVTRWETGVFALWYPIKNRAAVERAQRTLMNRIQRPVLITELAIHAENAALGLSGSGLFIVNPPWQLADELKKVMPWLWRILSVNGAGYYKVHNPPSSS